MSNETKPATEFDRQVRAWKFCHGTLDKFPNEPLFARIRELEAELDSLRAVLAAAEHPNRDVELSHALAAHRKAFPASPPDPDGRTLPNSHIRSTHKADK